MEKGLFHQYEGDILEYHCYAGFIHVETYTIEFSALNYYHWDSSSSFGYSNIVFGQQKSFHCHH